VVFGWMVDYDTHGWMDGCLAFMVCSDLGMRNSWMVALINYRRLVVLVHRYPPIGGWWYCSIYERKSRSHAELCYEWLAS
jgi:hypothetical protein